MKQILFETPSLSVELATFSAGVRQARHNDRHSRITLTLWGAFREDSAAGAERLRSGDVLFKSRTAAHEDQFGEEGARVVSIVFRCDDFEAAKAPRWRVCRDGSALRLAFAGFEAALAKNDAAVTAAASDLLAPCGDVSVDRAPPRWLARLREALCEHSLARVDVASEARAVGVHPVHASRLFRRCFGMSITEHAQSQSVRRALRLLAGSEPLADAAQAAGFYDQSHMNRVFRRITGRSPAACRTLLAAGG